MAKVKSGPQTARLITLNDTDGTAYDIVPGGADSVDVEIPNRLAHLPFVQELAKEGQIILSDVEPEDDGLDDLRAEAESLGVKVDKRWKEERIQQEIDKAKKEKE